MSTETGLVDLYKDDRLPSLFFAEFERWKMKVQARIITADSCAASLKACDPDDFPLGLELKKFAVDSDFGEKTAFLLRLVRDPLAG